MIKRKSIIISLESYKLKKAEAELIVTKKPWGVILFKRNILNISQLKELTSQIKFLMRDPKYPILIDEEGGKVSRLSKIIDTSNYSQYFFGNIYKKNSKSGAQAYEEYLYFVSQLLKETGININTIPVLDVLKNNAHPIIGNRSFSSNLNTINDLKKICINVLNKYKIGTVIKHIPGHGRSLNDTHKKVSIIHASLNSLMKNDFKVFRNTKAKFAMTAHIIYKKVDPLFTATHSKIIINNIIRRKIGFKGILISDDISMKALSKNLVYNATKALSSGCNLVLYCRGNIEESSALLNKIKDIDNYTMKKTSEFYKFLG